MNKSAKRPFLILGIWVSILLVMAFFSLFQPGIGTRWEKIPNPPEPIENLALGNSGEIIVHTSNGDIYELQMAIGWPKTWTKVSDLSGNPVIGWSCTAIDRKLIVLSPPGKAKTRISEACVIFESIFYLEFALLETGDVWLWVYDSYAYTNFAMIASLICGLLMGIPVLVIGIVRVFNKTKITSKEI